MPSGNRIRSNNVFGVISDNPLTVGATAFNSASLFLLPIVSSAHAIIVLDPKRVNGEPEIVVVTAHTALATVATITRGAYGTTARSHPLNTPWAHVVVSDDEIPVVTSSTRPTDPYRGQLIFESDTDKLVGRTQTDVWMDAIPFGAWQTYTPALSNITLGNGTVTGKFARYGRTIIACAYFTFGSTSSIAGRPGLGVPVAKTPTGYHGSGYLLDVGAKEYHAGVRFSTDTNVEFLIDASPNGVYNNTSPPFVMGTGDVLEYTITYEAAS